MFGAKMGPPFWLGRGHAPPTIDSWAMESTLVPCFHYIPVDVDFENLVERAQWCVDNPVQCEAIARQGACHMANSFAGSYSSSANFPSISAPIRPKFQIKDVRSQDQDGVRQNTSSLRSIPHRRAHTCPILPSHLTM